MPIKFDLKDPKLKVWFLCHQCHNLVSKCTEAVLWNYEINSEQYHVLMAIKYLTNPVKTVDVAKWLNLKINTIIPFVTRLQQRSLIKRIRDLADRRSTRLVITQKGEQILDQAMIQSQKLIREILSDLSESELQILASLMGKVRGKAFNYLYSEAP